MKAVQTCKAHRTHIFLSPAFPSGIFSLLEKHGEQTVTHEPTRGVETICAHGHTRKGRIVEIDKGDDTFSREREAGAFLLITFYERG